MGFTSGSASLVDLRRSRNVSTWRAHESEMIASTRSPLVPNHLVTTSFDQTIKIWDINNGNLLMTYRSLSDAAICVDCHDNEIISTLSSNRLMIHQLPSSGSCTINDKPSLNTKLRGDLIKGSLTAICLLPLKRQLLAATEHGVVKLFS